jgi:hypothetical protein
VAALSLSNFKIDRNSDCNVKTSSNKITLEVPTAVDSNVMSTSSWVVSRVTRKKFIDVSEERTASIFGARKVSQESNLSISRAARSVRFGLRFNPEDGGSNFVLRFFIALHDVTLT